MFPAVVAAASSTKRLVAIVLAVVLVIAIALVAATSGLGRPGVPSGDVAFVAAVDDGGISQEEFDAALSQTAAQLGLPEAPPPEDQQYEQVFQQTMQQLIQARWVRGEAAERGIEVSPDEVQTELDRAKEENFKTDKEFQQFLKQSNFTDEDVSRQLELNLLSQQLQEAVLPSPDQQDPEAAAAAYGVDDTAIESFYDANIESFAVPASRDVRVILNSSEQKAQQARDELEADGSDESWKKVAAKYSQDQASKDRGGLLEGLTEGQNDPQLEDEVFAAPEGELIGPFETDRGFYVAQVSSITEAQTQPLEEATPAITQQLVSVRQQQVSTDFQSDFVDKWTKRTSCAPDYEVPLCNDYVAPVEEVEPGQPSPPAVPSRQPIAPGDSTLPADGSIQQGLPQAPQSSLPAPAAAGQLPEGAVPIGPDGQPANGGAVPPSGAGGAAPPAGAAPQTAP